MSFKKTLSYVICSASFLAALAAVGVSPAFAVARDAVFQDDSRSDVKGNLAALSDLAEFADRADKAGIMEDIAMRYMVIAFDTRDQFTKMRGKIENNIVNPTSEFLSANYYFSVEEIVRLYKIAEECDTRAKELETKLKDADIVSSSYAGKVAEYEKVWSNTIEDAKKYYTGEYDEGLPFYQNIENNYETAVIRYFDNINSSVNEIENLLNNDKIQTSPLTADQKEVIRTAINDFRDVINKAIDDYTLAKDAYYNRINGIDGDDADKPSDVATAGNDPANSADPAASKDTEKEQEKAADLFGGLDVGGGSSSSTTSNPSSASTPSSSGGTGSSERTPYCSRSAGVAGRGDNGGAGNGSIGSGNGDAVGPTNPAACKDIANIYDRLNLKSHGLDFSVFVNAMKGYNQLAGENGKLAIDVMTNKGNTNRYYVMDLKDFNEPKLLQVVKSSHGKGGEAGSPSVPHEAVGKGVVMSNVDGSWLSSIGFVKSVETYKSGKDWPIKLNDAGHNGRRLKGYEPGYNSNVYNRGVVMHSCCKDSDWGGYAPRSGGCHMFKPSEAKAVIMDAVGEGTLIYTHNEDADTNDHYLTHSQIINGNHGISDDCK